MSGLEDRIAVVVPTYWTRPGGGIKPGDAMYDHPTPIDRVGTLGRLIESLIQLDPARFYVIVVVAVTNSEFHQAASNQVRSIASQFRNLDILVADQTIVATVERHLGPSKLVGLAGYSEVRNLQLLLPLVLGSSAIVAVDDDEVVLDPEFLDRATNHLGDHIDGHIVAGLGGFYLQDEHGNMLLFVPDGVGSASNVFDRKAAIMNEAAQKLEALPGDVVPTPFCFGGNMAFTPDLAADICFDPAITRGEDIDYLINARLAGRWFFMNKRLTILHLPPAGGSYADVSNHKVVQDVLRFVYEREKLKAWREIGATMQITARDLDPYPGLFLRNDLDTQAMKVIQRVIDSTDSAAREALALPDTAAQFMDLAITAAEAGVRHYPHVQAEWRALAAAAPAASELNRALNEAVAWRTDTVAL